MFPPLYPGCLLLPLFITVVPCCNIQVAQMGGQPEQGPREQVVQMKSMNVYPPSLPPVVTVEVQMITLHFFYRPCPLVLEWFVPRPYRPPFPPMPQLSRSILPQKFALLTLLTKQEILEHMMASGQHQQHGNILGNQMQRAVPPPKKPAQPKSSALPPPLVHII